MQRKGGEGERTHRDWCCEEGKEVGNGREIPTSVKVIVGLRHFRAAINRPAIFYYAVKKKARQLENKAGTKGAKCGGNVWEIRWPGCSAADNETCATFRRHSRRQGTEQSMQ